VRDGIGVHLRGASASEFERVHESVVGKQPRAVRRGHAGVY
jgi:hypothetical protein